MSLFLVVLILAAVVTAIGIVKRTRWLAVAAPSALIGGITYLTVSVLAARLKGAGRFYSIPFGGYDITDGLGVLASTLFWVVLCGIALHLILPRWEKPGKEEPHKDRNLKALGLRALVGAGPLALTPVFGWLIAEDCISFGGGCKDIVMIFPWMAWSLLYLVVFVFMSVNKAPLGRSAAVSAGWATGALALILAGLLVFSLAGAA